MKQRTIRKLLLFLMVLLIAPSGAWAGHSVTDVEANLSFTASDLDGTGDYSTPYVIKTVTGWNALANAIADVSGTGTLNFSSFTQEGGTGAQSKMYVELGANIDLSTMSLPLGTYDLAGNPAFKGHFDGKGYIISGTKAADRSYFAVFGDIIDAEITNLTISGLKISNTYGNTALLVGQMRSGAISNITIENSDVTFTGTANSFNYGGVVGTVLGGTVTNCVVKNVRVKGVNGGAVVRSVGVIAGSSTIASTAFTGNTYDARCKVQGLNIAALSNYWDVEVADVPTINEQKQLVGVGIGSDTYPYDVAGAKYVTTTLAIAVATDGQWNAYDFKNKIVPTTDKVTLTDLGEAISYDAVGVDGFFYCDALKMEDVDGTTYNYTVENNTLKGDATIKVQLPRLDYRDWKAADAAHTADFSDFLADDANLPFTNQKDETFSIVARDISNATIGIQGDITLVTSETTYNGADQQALVEIQELVMNTLTNLTLPGTASVAKKWSENAYDTEATLTQSLEKYDGGAWSATAAVTNAGRYRIKIEGTDNYTGTMYSKEFTVKKLQLHRNAGQESKAGYVIYDDITNPVYDGTAKEPTPDIKVVLKDDEAGTLITISTDYTFSYEDNINVAREFATDLTSPVQAGAKINVNAAADGNFEGTVSKNFQIDPKTITAAVADYTWATTAPTEDIAVTTGDFVDATFDNTDHKPSFTIKDLYRNVVLTEGADVTSGDFTALWKDGAGNAATELKDVTYGGDPIGVVFYTQTIQGQGNYTGTITRYKRIFQADLAAASKTHITITPKVYNTETQTASEYTVTYDHATTVTLVEGDDKDFTVTKNDGGKDVIAAPFYEFEITAAAQGNYKNSYAVGAGHTENGFEITQKSLADDDVTFIYTNAYTYTGAAIPAIDDVTGTFGNDNPLAITTDYTNQYKKGGADITPAGVLAAANDYQMVLTGAGNYKDTKTLNFVINALDLTTCKVDFSTETLTFNKADQAPATINVFVDNDGDDAYTTGDYLIPTADYTLSYKDVRAADFGTTGCYTHASDVFVKATYATANVTNATDGTHKYAITPKTITQWTTGTYTDYDVTNTESTLDSHQYEGETIAILPGAGVIAFTDNYNTPSPMVGAAYADTPALTTDYQVKYEKQVGTEWNVVEAADVKDAGDYRMTIEGINDYTGNHVKTFTIAKRTLIEAMFNPYGTNVWSKVFTGKTLKATINNGGFTNTFTHSITLAENTDYTITANYGGINPDTYTVTIDAAGDNYQGQVTGLLFVITKRPLSQDDAEGTFEVTLNNPDVDPNHYTYTGDEIKPTYTIVYKYIDDDGAAQSIVLTTSGVNPDLGATTYPTSCTDASTTAYVMTANAAGTSQYFKDTRNIEYFIDKFDLANAKIGFDTYDLTFSNADKKPTNIYVFIDKNNNDAYDAGTEVLATEATDYTLAYKDTKHTGFGTTGYYTNAGAVYVKATAEATSTNFTGNTPYDDTTEPVTGFFYTIKPKTLKDDTDFTWTPATGNNYTNKTFTGSALEPAENLAITDAGLSYTLDMPSETYPDVATSWEKSEDDGITWNKFTGDKIDAGLYRQVIVGKNEADGSASGNYYTTAAIYRTFQIEPKSIRDIAGLATGNLTFAYNNPKQTLSAENYSTTHEGDQPTWWSLSKPTNSLFGGQTEFDTYGGIRYMGDAIEFAIVFKDPANAKLADSYNMVENTDYEVEYKNNEAARLFDLNPDNSPYVKITGKGNYKGEIRQYFTITKQYIGYIDVAGFDVPEVGVALTGASAYVYLEDNTGDRTLQPEVDGFHGNIIKNSDKSVMTIASISWTDESSTDCTNMKAEAGKVYTAHIGLSILAAKRASYELETGYADYEAEVDSFPASSSISGAYEMTIHMPFPKTPQAPDYAYNKQTRRLTIEGTGSIDTNVKTRLSYAINGMDEEFTENVTLNADNKVKTELDAFDVNSITDSRVSYLKALRATHGWTVDESDDAKKEVFVPMALGAHDKKTFYVTAAPAVGQINNIVTSENIDNLDELATVPDAKIPYTQIGTKVGYNVSAGGGTIYYLKTVGDDEDTQAAAEDDDLNTDKDLLATVDWHLGKNLPKADDPDKGEFEQVYRDAPTNTKAYTLGSAADLTALGWKVLPAEGIEFDTTDPKYKYTTFYFIAAPAQTDDEYAYSEITKYRAEKMTEFTANNEWSTFVQVDNKDLKVPDSLFAYTVASANAESGTIQLSAPQGVIKAQTPVLLRAKKSGVKFYLSHLQAADAPAWTATVSDNFKGVTDDAGYAVPASASTTYVLHNNEFVKAVGGTVAKGRCYLSFNGTYPHFVRGFVLPTGDEEVDAIKAVDAAEQFGEGDWYDLNGRKLDKQPAKKGLYIFNGTKVVIK